MPSSHHFHRLPSRPRAQRPSVAKTSLMKTLLISDIHSNIVALEAIWAQEKDCDQVICAGDLVDVGFWPREVIAWIQAHHVPCVMGNHDSWVAAHFRTLDRYQNTPENELGWEVHNARLLREEDVTFLESLPDVAEIEIDGAIYGMRHLVGAFDENIEIQSLHAYNQFTAEHFSHNLSHLIVGHTHRQAVHYLSRHQRWINPGSVSYRRRDDPDQTAHYMTIVDGEISFHRLAYDRTPLRQHLAQLCLNEPSMQTAQRIFS